MEAPCVVDNCVNLTMQRIARKAAKIKTFIEQNYIAMTNIYSDELVFNRIFQETLPCVKSTRFYF